MPRVQSRWQFWGAESGAGGIGLRGRVAGVDLHATCNSNCLPSLSLHPLCTISPPPDFSLFRRLPFLYRQFSLSTLRKIMRVIKNMRASAALKAMARLFASAYQRKMGRGTSGHVSRMGKSWNYNGKSCTQAPWARVSATEVTLWL